MTEQTLFGPARLQRRPPVMILRSQGALVVFVVSHFHTTVRCLGIPGSFSLSAKNLGVDGQLLTDTDDVGVLDVVPLLDLSNSHAKTDGDAGENVTGSYCVNDVAAIVDIGALGIVLPAVVLFNGCAASYFLELSVIEFHIVCHDKILHSFDTGNAFFVLSALPVLW